MSIVTSWVSGSNAELGMGQDKGSCDKTQQGCLPDGNSSDRSLLIGGHVGQGTSKNFRELAEPAIIAWREPAVIG